MRQVIVADCTLQVGRRLCASCAITRTPDLSSIRYGSLTPTIRNGEKSPDQAIENWTQKHDKHELRAELQALGIPAGPVNTAADFFTDRQLEARGYFVELTHPEIEKLPYPGTPVLPYGVNCHDHTGWRAAP